MALVSLSKKKSFEVENRSFRPESCLFKLMMNRLFAAFLLLLIIFIIWSSSTFIIPGSIAHVCVTSRKLSNLYCLSAGSKSINYNISINTTKISQVFPTKFSEFTKPVIRKGVDKAKAEAKAESRKVVEAQLAVLRSYVAKKRPTSCEGRGVYVYDMPSKFNKDLVAKCNETIAWHGFCNHLTNYGMGEPILELGKGWYNTHQFLLEPIFHNRILKHPCRVEKEEEAKLFYVPFYGALDMLRSHFSKNASEKDVHVLSNEVVQWLQKQRMWKRNLGLDHVFVLGKNSWDLRRSKNLPWGTPLLEFDELQNPIKLIIERQPWHMNDVGVPYPTYFHPSSDGEIIAWQEKIRQVQRKYLISFAGAPRDDPSSIRSILIEQCTSSAPEVCKFLNCAEQLCVESAPVVKLFMESEFCLQPDGDSPTRKSFFDSLVGGCIPVVFDPFTAHYQYPWHLPEDYTKYSVFIEQEDVSMSEVNVVEKLRTIPLRQRQEMRRYIIDELMPRLVYAHVDSKLEKLEDAFTIAVNNLIEMAVSRLT